jgi:hypothetical protein
MENAKVDNAIRRTLICQGDENRPMAKLSKLLVLNVCQFVLFVVQVVTGVGSGLISWKGFGLLLLYEDMEQMAEDMAGSERSSAAKKVLEAVRDSPEIQCREKALQAPVPLLQRH